LGHEKKTLLEWSMTVTDELERMWKEAGVAYLKVKSQN
jgi:hypothetical protein